MSTPLDVVVPLVSRIRRLGLLHTGETTLKILLLKTNIIIDTTTVLADLTPNEADFDGYTAGGIALTWTTGYITPDNVPSNESNLANWVVPASPVVTNTIYGWWVQNMTDLIMAGNLPDPVGMAVEGNALKIMLEDSYPPGLASVQVVP